MNELISYLENIPLQMDNTTRTTVLQRIKEIVQQREVKADLIRLHTAQERRKQDLASHSACTSNMAVIYNSFYGLKPQSLKEIAIREFYNPDVMKAITCITTAIIEEQNSGVVKYFQRILRWIYQLHQIGFEGPATVGGIAFRADLADVEGLYVFKIPKPDQPTDSLLHEYLVGILATNRLREMVPNFTYIYGYFYCAPPLVDLRGDTFGWCTNDIGPGYLVMENIAPARSLIEYLKSAELNSNEFISYYLQIILALRTAFILLDFTHYDLHTGNVLLREISGLQRFQIPYETNTGTRWLVTNRVATLIDYGYSHFYYQNNYYGTFGLEEFAILPNRSNPLHDIYKLLLYSYYDIPVNFRQNITPLFSYLVRFFNPTDPLEAIVKSQRATYYSWPTLTPPLTSIDNFINYLLESPSIQQPILLNAPDPRIPILNCRNMRCSDYQTSLRSAGLVPGNIPTTLFDLYDALNRIKSINEMVQVKTRFPYEQIAAREFNDFKLERAQFRVQLSAFQSITLRQAITHISAPAAEDVERLFREQKLDPNSRIVDLQLHRIRNPEIIFARGTHSLYRYKVQSLVKLYFTALILYTQQQIFQELSVIYQDNKYISQRLFDIDLNFIKPYHQELYRDEGYLDSLVDPRKETYDVYNQGIFLALQILVQSTSI